jgi:hypothetical protein
MGTLGAGIAGGVGSDMLQQRQLSDQREFQQRQRENEAGTMLANSGDPELAQAGLSILGAKPPRTTLAGGTVKPSDEYVQGLTLAHDKVSQLIQHITGQGQPPPQGAPQAAQTPAGASPAQEQGSAGLGQPIAAGGPPPAPGGVQTTLPAGSGSAAMAPTAVTGAGAPPPVPQASGPPQPGPPSSRMAPFGAAYQGQLASEREVAAAGPKAYGEALGGESGKLAALQLFIGRSGGIDTADPATIRAGRMAGLFPPPHFNYTDVNYEDLPPKEQALATMQDPKAGPGFTVHRGYDSVTGEKEFSATSRPGFTTPDQFNSVIDALAPNTIAGKPNQTVADWNRQAKMQVAAMLSSHNYAEANKTLDALRQTMDKYRSDIDPTKIEADTRKAVNVHVEGQQGVNNLPLPTVTLSPGEEKIAGDLAYGGLPFSDFNGMYSSRNPQGQARKEAIYAKAKDLNPSFSPAEYETGLKLYGNPQMRQRMVAIDALGPAIDKAIALSKNLPANTDLPTVNRLIQGAGFQIGNRTVTSLNQLQTLLGDEAGLALGVGTGSDMKTQLGLDLVNTKLGTPQFIDTMNQLRSLLGNRRDLLLGTMGPYGKGNTGGPPNPNGHTAAPKVGDVVAVPGGKHVKITALHPDGSFDGDEVK